MWPIALPDPIVIASPAAPIHAFQPNIPPGTWPASAFPVPFVLALPRARDVGAEAAAELEVALRTWPRVTCTAWRARYDGERAAVAADDGINVVLFHDDAWPLELVPGAVAQTVIHTDASGRYRDADIHVNGKDFRFSLDGAAGTLDLRSILVHELGHALGLGHSDDPRATMFATGSGLRWRSLEKDDVAGVCALYPGQGASGCEAAACPAPFVCVAGACQRPNELRNVCSPCQPVPGACEAAGDDARCTGGVCGRSCATDTDCGAGFHCKATTTSGDRQCLADVGPCVGRPDAPDGGTDGGDAGSTDAATDDGARLEPGGGGCSCDVIGDGSPLSRGKRWSLAWLCAAALTIALRHRSGRV